MPVDIRHCLAFPSGCLQPTCSSSFKEPGNSELKVKGSWAREAAGVESSWEKAAGVRWGLLEVGEPSVETF